MSREVLDAMHANTIRLDPALFGHWLEYNESAAKDAKEKIYGVITVNLEEVLSGQSQTPP
jgi:hypothetical protein